MSRVKLLLDCGAFTAWRRGETIDVGEYIEYIKRHKRFIDTYVALDTIPGSLGKMTDRLQDVEQSAERSYKNLRRMRRAGLMPIPIFHQGEALTWLDRLLDDGYDYVGLSPYARAHMKRVDEWLGQCFERIAKRVGYVRTHGFGATSPHLILKYPWFSVDSSSWVTWPGYGLLYIPPFVDGAFSYTRPPQQYTVSDKPSPFANRHYQAMGRLHQQMIARFLEEAGTSLEEAKTSLRARWRVMVYYFLQLEKTKQGLSQEPFKIVFTTNLSRQGHFLTAMGITNRLVSYYELKGRDDNLLPLYVEEGTVARSAEGRTRQVKPRKRERIYGAGEAR